MRIAFKEWAIVVDALGRGDQILILRKGGLREGSRGFRVEHTEFLLFPTLFHQQRESVIPSAQGRYDEIAPNLAPSTILRLEYFARVAWFEEIESLEAAQRLKGQHIWRDEVIAERFEWGRDKAIHALAVRIFRLGSTFELPMLPEYGGCKSWVEVANDLETESAAPILNDEEFGRKLKQMQKALIREENG
jgi:hypothetical protein